MWPVLKFYTLAIRDKCSLEKSINCPILERLFYFGEFLIILKLWLQHKEWTSPNMCTENVAMVGPFKSQVLHWGDP